MEFDSYITGLVSPLVTLKQVPAFGRKDVRTSCAKAIRKQVYDIDPEALERVDDVVLTHILEEERDDYINLLL